MGRTRYIEGQERYALAEVAGRGGFATVWRARSLEHGDDVAVKVIPVFSDGERSRALREGQIAESLRHPNIVDTLEVIPGENEVYLVTEFVEGLPLDDAAEEYEARDIIDSVAQVLEALVYAHDQGVIHRDIKPQNALVDERGTVKLTDFGVAYRHGDTRLTQVGFAVGTPGYIAPEIMDGEDPSELSDVYAVGATTRTLLARYPYEPPQRLTEFVNRATAPNPDHRPQGARAALRLLTGRRAPAAKPRRAGRAEARKKSSRPARTGERAPALYSETALRMINGLLAGWLGFLGAELVLPDAAGAAGIAAGMVVLGYLLPRLAALGVIVALAVVLLMNAQAGAGTVGMFGWGFSTLVPAIGGFWVLAGGAASSGVTRLPLGPILAVPLAAVGLGAGLPILLGAMMRPMGAALSAAAGALALAFYDLVFGGNVVRYLGIAPGVEPGMAFRWGLPQGFTQRGAELLSTYPALGLQAGLWAGVAVLVSLGEWTGRWVAGLLLATGVGVLGYAILASSAPAHQSQAMTSLGLAAIMYGAFKLLVSRVKR